MLNRDDAVLMVIDVQERLVGAMHGRERLLAALDRLMRGARVLGLPLVCTEQNPGGLGPTVAEVAGLLAGVEPIAKTAFSGCGAEGAMLALQQTGRSQVLLAGIEAHVCVYQTAADLIARGYRPQVVADAVSSRRAEDRAVGLEKARAAGAEVTSVETALFEMLRDAADPAFQQILQIVK